MKYKITFEDTLSGAKQTFDKVLNDKEVASVKRDIKAKKIVRKFSDNVAYHWQVIKIEKI